MENLWLIKLRTLILVKLDAAFFIFSASAECFEPIDSSKARNFWYSLEYKETISLFKVAISLCR
jgi:hypothetical protein